jgi:hypothetical protein
MPFVNEKQPGQNTITVDRERNVKLIHHFPMPESPYQLELLVGEKRIMIDVIENTPILGQPKLDVYWKILRIYINDTTRSQKDVIISLIKEALSVYGSYGSLDKVNSVSVDFTQTHWE